MYVYAPLLSFTVQETVPVKATSVVLSTPGPVRWKSWMELLSFTVILYVPGLSVFTAAPSFVRLIVKPGPTVPTRPLEEVAV